MSDKEDGRKRLEQLKGEMQDSLERLADALRDQVHGLAADLGEPINEANASYFDALAALYFIANSDANSPEVHGVDEIARSVPHRSARHWREAKARLEELESTEDHTGETLGFGELLDAKDDVDRILAECPKFYLVPLAYAPTVGEACVAIMKVRDKAWWDMPIGWCNVYALIVQAIVNRCNPTP